MRFSRRSAAVMVSLGLFALGGCGSDDAEDTVVAYGPGGERFEVSAGVTDSDGTTHYRIRTSGVQLRHMTAADLPAAEAAFKRLHPNHTLVTTPLPETTESRAGVLSTRPAAIVASTLTEDNGTAWTAHAVGVDKSVATQEFGKIMQDRPGLYIYSLPAIEIVANLPSHHLIFVAPEGHTLVLPSLPVVVTVAQTPVGP